MQQKTIIPPSKSELPMDPLFTLYYPHYFENSLSQRWQKLYKKNGLFSLIKSLNVHVVSDIEECRKLWEEFSPNTSLFDTWEFRYAFWKACQDEPYFLVLKDHKENFALLPLWYEKEKKKYFWFGSWWMEDNQFFVKDDVFIPLLLSVSPTPVHLNAVSADTVAVAKKYMRFKPDDPKFTLDVSGFSSLDEYLATLKKKKRYNLKRDRKHIENLAPQIIYDRFEDFETLVNLCNRRFHQKGEDTDWEDPQRVETFRQVIEIGKKHKSYGMRMISLVIGDKIAAVDLITTFNRCYYSLKCGYDVKNFPGIGNYVNLLEIEDAIALGMKKMDFLEYDYGWKDTMFEKIELFKYDKK